MSTYKHKIGSYETRYQEFLERLRLLSPAEIGYIAGLVDGEGTITIHSVGERKHAHYAVHFNATVIISNTDKNMLEWLFTRLGGRSKQQKGWDRGNGAKPIDRWYVCGKRAAALCSLIFPLLLTYKKHRASLVVRLFDGCENRKFRIDDQEVQRRLAILSDYRAIER